MPAEAEFTEGTRFLSKAFMLKLTEISHKYQLMAQLMVKNQQEARRHEALRNKDSFSWLKANAATEGRKMKLAMEIEDITFDYFGIISMQYEISNRQLDRDMDYQVTKLKMQSEISRTFNPPAETEGLTLEKAEPLAKRIQDFTMEIMQGMAKVDPQSGKKYMDMGSGDFQTALAMEKDRFLMDTGFTCEQVSQFLQKNRAYATAPGGGPQGGPQGGKTVNV